MPCAAGGAGSEWRTGRGGAQGVGAAEEARARALFSRSSRLRAVLFARPVASPATPSSPGSESIGADAGESPSQPAGLPERQPAVKRERCCLPVAARCRAEHRGVEHSRRVLQRTELHVADAKRGEGRILCEHGGQRCGGRSADLVTRRIELRQRRILLQSLAERLNLARAELSEPKDGQ